MQQVMTGTAHMPRQNSTPGDNFNYRMEARDGSFGLISGAFSAIEEHRLISYTLEDNRTVSIRFT